MEKEACPPASLDPVLLSTLVTSNNSNMAAVAAGFLLAGTLHQTEDSKTMCLMIDKEVQKHRYVKESMKKFPKKIIT